MVIHSSREKILRKYEDSIKYEEHKWPIGGDLKVVALLLGLHDILLFHLYVGQSW